MPLNDAFTTFPTLETPTLVLRQTRLSDAEAMFPIFSDDETMRFYGMMPHKIVEEAEDLVRAQHAWYANRQGIRWAITRKADDTLIGSCGFHNFDASFLRAEIGYELYKALWGQGIMGEALQAIIAFAFTQMDLNRIEAIVDGDNQRSKALLQRLGFTYEGCMRQRFHFHDQFWDEHWFSLLQQDHQPTQ